MDNAQRMRELVLELFPKANISFESDYQIISINKIHKLRTNLVDLYDIETIKEMIVETVEDNQNWTDVKDHIYPRLNTSPLVQDDTAFGFEWHDYLYCQFFIDRKHTTRVIQHSPWPGMSDPYKLFEVAIDNLDNTEIPCQTTAEEDLIIVANTNIAAANYVFSTRRFANLLGYPFRLKVLAPNALLVHSMNLDREKLGAVKVISGMKFSKDISKIPFVVVNDGVFIERKGNL